MRIRHLLRASASAAVLSAVMATGAFAQEEPAAVEDENTVDTIIVTVNKREQSLQEVPATVTALSGELMQDAGVKDIKDLQILTPGLTVTSTSNETVTTARIRGVGTVGDNPGLESSVGIVIDGVYRPRNGVSFGDLGELERIEVLKGPQGTLFGKNTSAGVINILTAEPEFEFGGAAELTAGNYGAIGGSASVTGPVFGDNVAGRLFFAKRERDGFLDVVTGDGPRGNTEDVDQDFWTVRGQILATPSDDLSIRLIADYTERNENCCLATQLQVGNAANSRANLVNQVQPGGINADTNEDPFSRRAYANRSTRQFIQDKGFSAQIDWDITPDIAITSITAARTWLTETGQDSDFTAADLVYRPNDGTNFVSFDQFSQELRANGEAGPVNWLVGAFYASEDLSTRSRLNYGSDYYAYFATRVLGGAPALIGLTPANVYQPGAGSDDRYKQSDETFAIFTDNTWSITESLKLTAGLRYTWSDKSLTTDYTTTGSSCDQGEAAFATLAGVVGVPTATAIVGGLCLNAQNNDFDALGVYTQSRSEEELTGTIKLAWNVTEDVMLYGSYARGYKSGGFNLDRVNIACPFGGRTTTTLAGLPCVNNTQPIDFQPNPDTSFEGEKADSWELGVKTEWFDNSLLLNATLFHQKFTDFQLNTFVGTAFIVESIPELTSTGVDADFLWFTPVDGLSIQGGVTYAKTEFGDFDALDLTDPSKFNGIFRLPGSTAPFAPEWSTSLAASYERNIGSSLAFRGNLSWKYTTEYNTGSDLHPVKEQEGFSLVNGRVGIGSQDGRWTVELWANNLFDEEYIQVAFNGPFQVDTSNPYNPTADANISTYDAFLGAPRTWGLTLRSKF
ncbi:MAG TPA: TonB-dependent receptor [Caulobacter sp.]|nr:TonB-dependent receptor [Caulobacter sp.]